MNEIFLLRENRKKRRKQQRNKGAQGIDEKHVGTLAIRSDSSIDESASAGPGLVGRGFDISLLCNIWHLQYTWITKQHVRVFVTDSGMATNKLSRHCTCA